MLHESGLMPGLKTKVVDAIARSMLIPENRDLTPDFWKNVGENLTDSRLYYVPRMGLPKPDSRDLDHPEPSSAYLDRLIKEMITDEKRRTAEVGLPPLPKNN